jgi:UDP-GlcNAc:undecaprenyl-phosphate GlcNAc-1-phosphate transferase
MTNHFTVFFMALLASLVFTPLVRRVAVNRGWLDAQNDKRRIHRKPVPRLGGVAIFGSVLFSLAAISLLDHDILSLLQAKHSRLLALLVPATIMFLLGLYDDLRGTGAKLKFAVQGLAGTLFYLIGGRIDSVSVPFIGHVDLPVVLGYAFTVLWIVLVTNAFNLIDGMDGLAAGTALFASAMILMVALFLNHPLVAIVTIALCGAVTGFLRFNFNPASIFLGDSGSLFIGFTLAALSLLGAQKASTSVAIAIPLMICGLPLMDTGLAVFRRFVSRRPLFDADREHVHHMLLARGWSQGHVAVVLYAVCAIFGFSALIFVGEHGLLTGLMLLLVAAGAAISVGRLRYHEVDEAKATARRQIIQSPRRALNNLRVWRASRAMSNAKALGELFSAVQEMLECGEFVYANIQIGRSGDEGSTLRDIELEPGLKAMRGLQVRNGLICWSWERGDMAAEQVLGSRNYWSIRLPLSTEKEAWGFINLYRDVEGEELQLNVNYLKNSFQREMARAVERVMLEEGSRAPALLPEAQMVPRLAAHA